MIILKSQKIRVSPSLYKIHFSKNHREGSQIDPLPPTSPPSSRFRVKEDVVNAKLLLRDITKMIKIQKI